MHLSTWVLQIRWNLKCSDVANEDQSSSQSVHHERHKRETLSCRCPSRPRVAPCSWHERESKDITCQRDRGTSFEERKCTRGTFFILCLLSSHVSPYVCPFIHTSLQNEIIAASGPRRWCMLSRNSSWCIFKSQTLFMHSDGMVCRSLLYHSKLIKLDFFYINPPVMWEWRFC